MKAGNYMNAVLLSVSFSLLTACSGGFSNVSPDVGNRVDQLNKTFSDISFTARVGLHVHGYHYVNGDGKPLEDKAQSKRKGSKGLFTRTYALAEGEVGHGFGAYAQDRNTLQVTVSKEGGFAGAWNPSNIMIDYGRPITASDLEPQAVANALSAVIIIKGYEPGSEFDDILKDVDQPSN